MPDSRAQTTLMLWAALAMPLLYFGVQLMAVPFYPGYHFATDTASMLGTSVSRHPGIFNTGAILTGIAGLAGAFGLFLGLRRSTAGWLRILIAIALLSNGVMSLKAGLYPMPDPRHTTWQFLLFPVLITPLLLLGASWRVLWLRIYGCVALFVGKRTVEKAAAWKSPTAGLFHSAWKSRNTGGISHFSHRPRLRMYWFDVSP